MSEEKQAAPERPDFTKWNYRLTKAGGVFVMREIYYDEDDKIMDISKEAASPMGQTVEEFREDLARYNEAAQQDAIDFDQLYLNREIEKVKQQYAEQPTERVEENE